MPPEYMQTHAALIFWISSILTVATVVTLAWFIDRFKGD